MSTPRLVLFDVDGTLLSAGRAFRQALSEALTAIFGTAGPWEGFDFSGKTDPQIVRELMRLAHLAEARITQGLAAALERYRALLAAELRPADVVAKPGVEPLLLSLAADPRVTLGLLTGNLEPCARIKLEPLGLNRFFPFGAYGSDSEDRHDLPAIAVERALRNTGRSFEGKRIVIVGDSIHDVRCGRGLGARAVAVASGRTPRERLAAEAPDALLDDLSDTAAALAAILGEGERGRAGPGGGM